MILNEIQISKEELRKKFPSLIRLLANIDTHITELLQSNPALLDFSKWGIYLPEDYQVKLLRDKYFDVEQTEHFLSGIRLVDNQ